MVWNLKLSKCLMDHLFELKFSESSNTHSLICIYKDKNESLWSKLHFVILGLVKKAHLWMQKCCILECLPKSWSLYWCRSAFHCCLLQQNLNWFVWCLGIFLVQGENLLMGELQAISRWNLNHYSKLKVLLYSFK